MTMKVAIFFALIILMTGAGIAASDIAHNIRDITYQQLKEPS